MVSQEGRPAGVSPDWRHRKIYFDNERVRRMKNMNHYTSNSKFCKIVKFWQICERVIYHNNQLDIILKITSNGRLETVELVLR